MRDINKYLLAPIGENGSSVRARNQPHPNSLNDFFCTNSQIFEMWWIYHIVLHQMREWWILNLFGLIKLNTFDRICEIGYWSLKCISVFEEIGFVAIFLPFWKTLTLFEMFFHLLPQFTPILMFSTYSDTTQGNLCWCTLRVGESSKETLQCCCKENFQLENISSSTQFHKRPTPPPPTVWRIEDTETHPNI